MPNKGTPNASSSFNEHIHSYVHGKLIVEGIYLEIPAGRHVINFVYQHDQNILPSPPINEDAIVYLDDFKLSETAFTPRKERKY